MSNISLITNMSNYKDMVFVKTKDGMTMMINPNDQYISRQIAVLGEWEPHIRQALTNLIQPDMTVMDIGANLGSHTLLMSKLAGGKGQVIAFEPCKTNHNLLFINCLINKCSNVTIYKYGAGKKSEDVMYFEQRWNDPTKEDNYGAMSLQTTSTSTEDEKINILCIDDLQLQKLDVVKMDAEGMEPQILEGMKETMKRCTPKIILEIHAGKDTQIKSKLADEFGYDLFFIGGIDYIAQPKKQ